MRWIRTHRPSPGTAFGFAALMVALGGVAFAAIPDSNGTIHSCYQKSNGNLRVVESSRDCRNGEQILDWNRQGPPGPPGREIVARARSIGAITTASVDRRFLFPFTWTGSSIPLSGSHWTQGGSELNMFLGTFTYTKPFAGTCRGPIEGNLAIVIRAGDQVVGSAEAPGNPGDAPGTRTRNINVALDGHLFEPGSATPRTLTAEAADNCSDGHHFVIESVSVDAVAIR